MKIGISSCLGGVPCRYDGGAQSIDFLKNLVTDGKAVMVCPEVMGGLPTPRDPAEIIGGDGYDVLSGKAKICTATGEDVTEVFIEGAKKAYIELKKLDIAFLVLKEKSPSCGSQQIYDGTFSGIKKKGVGVATAYFQSQGVKVISDENVADIEAWLMEHKHG